MGSVPNEITSHEAEPTLQLRRALVPIDEYAVREGVTRGVVEECGKLGVLQIRRYRGKTFVVDVPLSPYISSSAADKAASRPVDEDRHFAKKSQNGLPKVAEAKGLPFGDALREKISELDEKVASAKPVLQKDDKKKVPEVCETNKELTASDSKSVESGAISALVEKMFNKSCRMTESCIKPLKDENGRVSKAADLNQVIHQQGHKSADQSLQLTGDASRFESVSESVRVPLSSPFEVDRPVADGVSQAECPPGPAKLSKSGIKVRKTPQLVSQMFRKVGQIINKLLRMAGSKTVRNEEESELPQVIEDEGIQFSPLTTDDSFYKESQSWASAAQARSKRGWRIVAFFSVLFLFVAFLANVWFYVDRQGQLDKLNLAYANIRTVYSNFVKADKQVKTLQNKLANSRAEIGRLQSELNKSRAEVKRIQSELDKSRAEIKTVRDQLAKAKQNIETTQRRNSQAVNRLKGQIQKLTEWMRESNNTLQPPVGPGISDE